MATAHLCVHGVFGEHLDSFGLSTFPHMGRDSLVKEGGTQIPVFRQLHVLIINGSLDTAFTLSATVTKQLIVQEVSRRPTNGRQTSSRWPDRSPVDSSRTRTRRPPDDAMLHSSLCRAIIPSFGRTRCVGKSVCLVSRQ